ncbi:hypothetical protein ONS95_007240 [Cadophora gregata]|uniref:uncharacterized protein n=1 Tax=Cadophora gregata TaxID=51156 RepID=UPI0026DB7D0A|nr:uncharacterized protein ONS95_007240 [Cadophora gregata]KAK0100792.1 hypothetical protein ONS95_007240 [Cadophora gregata]KAK0117213.1 hypothetical protein ONS96_013047 [Cadophora gregata f. sp. sojae]
MRYVLLRTVTESRSSKFILTENVRERKATRAAPQSTEHEIKEIMLTGDTGSLSWGDIVAFFNDNMIDAGKLKAVGSGTTNHSSAGPAGHNHAKWNGDATTKAR